MLARIISVSLVSALALAGCRTASVVSDSATARAQAPEVVIPAGADELPVGTSLHVVLQDELSTEQSKVGDEVRATLTTPVQDAAGKTLVPTGAQVIGKVTELKSSPRVGEPASIRIAFNELEMEGEQKPVTAEVTEAKPEMSRDYKRAAKGAGIGAAGGAVLGAVLGRSVKGAVVGGVLGAGAGTAISLGTGEEDAKLPAGTGMTLALTEPVSVE